MLVDSHCHLQDPRFGGDLEDVIQRAFGSSVSALVVAGYDLVSSERAVEIAASHARIYATIGVHPHDAKTMTAEALKRLSALADSARVVAVGEIGLDYYRNLSPPDVQREAFELQLSLARSQRLPAVIHSRNADEDTYAILEAYARGAPPTDRPLGVMHCYAGDLHLALRYIELGFVISIAGTVTYPNAERTSAVAAGVPLRWMTVETDAPYLASRSRRGDRNEPAYVGETVQFIANLRGEPYEDVASRTAETAGRLFGLGDIAERTTSAEAAR